MIMKFTAIEIFVIGDGKDVDPDRGGVEPLPFVRVRNDEGLIGLPEMFRVPVINGAMRLPADPGVGFDPLPDLIDHFRLDL